jgi:hypothetical protein
MPFFADHVWISKVRFPMFYIIKEDIQIELKCSKYQELLVIISISEHYEIARYFSNDYMKVCLLFLALLFGLFCCDGDENNNKLQIKNKKQQHMHTGSYYEWPILHKMQLKIAVRQNNSPFVIT